MFKAIWKGIKWFFSVNEKTHNRITRKHNHVVKQPTRVDPPIKVKGEPKDQSSVVLTSYNKMVDIHKDHAAARDNNDTIESAKRTLWIPHTITDAHKELILANCGFQKTLQQGDNFVYDPRLIQVVNYAMNMYAAEVAQNVEKIIRQNSIVE